jgi:hypothetical protein
MFKLFTMIIPITGLVGDPTLHPFFSSPAAPSRLHSGRVPVCSARSCGVGGRRFSITSVTTEILLKIITVSYPVWICQILKYKAQ